MRLRCATPHVGNAGTLAAMRLLIVKETVMNRWLIGFAVVFLVTGCVDTRTAVHRFTPAEADSAAHQMIAAVVAGDVEQAHGLLYSGVRNPEARKGIEQIVFVLAGRMLRDVELINSGFVIVNGRRWQDLLSEGRLGDEWVLVQFRLVHRGEIYQAAGFHVDLMPFSQRVVNGFWNNLQPLQAVWLLLALTCLAVIVLAIVRTVRAQIGRKWLWITVSSFGLVPLTMNWTTAHVSVQPLMFQLLGVGFNRPGLYGPLSLTWSLPIGALWSLWRLRRNGEAYPTGVGEPDGQLGITPAAPHGG
jgi:hypothetical protein